MSAPEFDEEVVPTTQKWSDKQIEDQIKKNMKEDGVMAVTVTDKIYKGGVTRNLLIVGCGDGGCNIASAIHTAIPETYAIAYNTSPRAMDNISADVKIIPAQEDGTGKVRSYSQEVFKSGSYKPLLENVQMLAEKMENLAYIVVTTTADGGTGGGVSPMIAKFLADNMDIPVIIVGVYPSLDEDAAAQYNAMQWQSEVVESGLPYMVFDNNSLQAMPKILRHRMVNDEIVDAMKVIAGAEFGETNISSIDNRDMYMLLNHLGNRIVVVSDTTRPTVNQTLDKYLENLLNSKDCTQEIPYDAGGIGIFLKGPKSFLDNADTSLRELRGVIGEATLQYTHLEESENFEVALVISGCTSPNQRLYMMRERYNDIKASAKKKNNDIFSIMDGMDDPVGGSVAPKNRKGSEPNLSALGL